MNYRVELAKQPQKYLRKLPKDQANYILDKIETVRDNPKHGPNVKRLKGEWRGFYRLRERDDGVVEVLLRRRYKLLS